jgi:hypothetical protein
VKHYDLLDSWGHGKLVKHMKNGGQPEDFDINNPDKEPEGFERIRKELNAIKLNLPEPKKTLKPLVNAEGTNKNARYQAGMEFPVGNESSMHVGTSGESGRRPREIRAGFQAPIAGGQLRATGSYSPNQKSVQAVYERRFDDGGYVDPMGATSSEVEPEDAEFMRRLAKKISEQVGKEVKLIATPSGAKDFLLNHVSAPIAGGMSDIANMGLEGIDYMREAAAKQNKRGYKRESVVGGDMVPPTVKPYASEKPFMGSDQFRDAFERQGATKGQDQTPITGMVGDIFANPLGALTAVKAVSKTGKALKSIKNGMK